MESFILPMFPARSKDLDSRQLPAGVSARIQAQYRHARVLLAGIQKTKKRNI